MTYSEFKTLLLISLITLVSLPASSSAECYDPDGDGYGLNGDRPCRTRKVRTKTTKPSGAGLAILERSVLTGSRTATINLSFSAAVKTRILFGETESTSKTGPYRFNYLRNYTTVLKNLKPGTKYYYRVRSVTRDRKDKLDSAIFEFTTKSSSTTSTTTPPTTTSTTTSTTTTTTTTTTKPKTACDASQLKTRVSTLLNSPDRIGFGAQTTGGAAANSITWVTNTNDSGPGSLRSAIYQTPPVWIAFDESLKNKTIKIKKPFHINDGNITLDGRGKDGALNITIKLDGATHGILMWKGNVILKGIRVDGNNSDATGVMARRGSNFWFDHLSVTNFRIDDALSVSMNSYVDSADKVTVSNYHVYNTNKGLLAGGEPNIHGLERHITVLKSQFSAFERNPTIYRGYKGHVYNNYMHNFTYGMHLSCKGIADVENNVFSGGSNALESGMNRYCVGSVDDGTGVTFSSGNIFFDGARETGNILDYSVVDIPYAYDLMPVDQVQNYVKNNSGAENAPGVCSGY